MAKQIHGLYSVSNTPTTVEVQSGSELNNLGDQIRWMLQHLPARTNFVSEYRLLQYDEHIIVYVGVSSLRKLINNGMDGSVM